MDQNKQQLPNAIATLVLGILSIVFCWGYLIIPLALGIIALVLSKKAVALNKENPELYAGYGNVKAGRICAIIGICLSAVWIIYIIVVVAILGTAMFSMGNIFGGM
jgi:M penetrans paralogue family 26